MDDLNTSQESTCKEEMDLYLALGEFLKKKGVLTENWSSYRFTFTARSNNDGPQLTRQILVRV